MSETIILDNNSFAQELQVEINEDSFEKRRGSIKNSRRGKSKALRKARARIKRAQVARRKIARRLR